MGTSTEQHCRPKWSPNFFRQRNFLYKFFPIAIYITQTTSLSPSLLQNIMPSKSQLINTEGYFKQQTSINRRDFSNYCKSQNIFSNKKTTARRQIALCWKYHQKWVSIYYPMQLLMIFATYSSLIISFHQLSSQKSHEQKSHDQKLNSYIRNTIQSLRQTIERQNQVIMEHTALIASERKKFTHALRKQNSAIHALKLEIDKISISHAQHTFSLKWNYFSFPSCCIPETEYCLG